MRIKVIKEHSFIEDLLENKEITVVDLGACRGEFIDEMDQLFRIKKAILVEANPTNFNQLEKNQNYVLYNRVISDVSNDTVTFFEDVKSPYNGSKMFNYFNGIQHDVKTITLEELMVENNIDYIDILKIDIEGSEYDVMLSISDEIYSKIGQITVEFHDFIDNNLKSKTEVVIKKLESIGFKRLSKGIRYMNNSDNYDVLFYK